MRSYTTLLTLDPSPSNTTSGVDPSDQDTPGVVLPPPGHATRPSLSEGSVSELLDTTADASAQSNGSSSSLAPPTSSQAQVQSTAQTNSPSVQDIPVVTSSVTSVSWAPSCGRSYHLIATGSRDGSVRIWKIQPGEELESGDGNGEDSELIGGQDTESDDLRWAIIDVTKVEHK